MRGLYDQLAPWEENALFETPVLTNNSLSGGGVAQLVKANPRRLGLWVSTGSNPFWIAPGNTLVAGANINTQQGAQVNTTNSPVPIHQDEWGVMAAMEWTAAVVTGQANPAQIGVIELLLRELPARRNGNAALTDNIRLRSDTERIPPATRAKYRAVWDMVLSACGGKRLSQ